MQHAHGFSALEDHRLLKQDVRHHCEENLDCVQAVLFYSVLPPGHEDGQVEYVKQCVLYLLTHDFFSVR